MLPAYHHYTTPGKVNVDGRIKNRMTQFLYGDLIDFLPLGDDLDLATVCSKKWDLSWSSSTILRYETLH
ncbi:TPA: hypothetical protein ACVO0S_001538 [Vibrio alginolyticus]